MSSVAQQFVSRTNDKGVVDFDLAEEMEDFVFEEVHMAVANCNSPNGWVAWTHVPSGPEQMVRIKFNHANNGEVVPLRDTQVTFTLQVWGDFNMPDEEPAEDPAE